MGEKPLLVDDFRNWGSEIMQAIGIDIGGTFTDIVMVEDGQIRHRKVLTTPDDPSRAVKEFLLNSSADLSVCQSFVHGTTVATNAVLEHKLPRVGLITTRGHRDRLEIQRTNASVMYDFFYRKPDPLVPRELREEVRERIAADGRVLEELDEEEVLRAASRLKQKGAQVIAVCFLNSYINPAHEQKAQSILKKHFPEVRTVTSFETLPEILEYERFSTTVLNASLAPIVEGYILGLEQFLTQNCLAGPFLIMQGNGGVTSAQGATKRAGAIFQSGPAAGVIATAYIGGLAGYRNLICFDMGGTSTDVCVIKEGEPVTTTDYAIERRPLRFPLIDVSSIGAGGGSIAWIDEGGGLHVGPQSAGANPGPACYGLGGVEPTVTDAHVVLGRLPDGFSLGGSLPVRRGLAQEAVAKVANFYKMSVVEAAAGILDIVNANMVNAIRAVSIERGLDPKDFVLVAYGGAGPLHGAILARELGIRVVLVPPYPGTHCALGLVVADYKHDFVRSIVKPLLEVEVRSLEETFLALEEEGKALLLQEGLEPGQIRLLRTCDLRYIGQAYVPVNIPVKRNLTYADLPCIREEFDRAHKSLYGHAAPTEPVELVNARVTALGVRPKVILAPDSKVCTPEEKEYGAVYFRETNGFTDTPFYRRDRLAVGETIEGPAVIFQADATTVVYPGQKAAVDNQGNLIINVS